MQTEDSAGESNVAAGLTAKSPKHSWNEAVSTLIEEDRFVKAQFEEAIPKFLDRIRRSVEIDRKFVVTVGDWVQQEEERLDRERRAVLEQYGPSDDSVEGSSNDSASESPSSDDETQRLQRRKPRRWSRWLMYICSMTFVCDVFFWICVLLLVATMFYQIFQHPPPFFGDGPPGWFNAKPHQGPPNYYAVLDINPNATDDQIRAAYHRQMRIHHPDKVNGPAASAANPGNSGDDKQAREAAANERMRLITAAYETLSNGSQRCMFDYSEWPKSKGGVRHMDGEQSLRNYYQCIRKSRRTLFQKKPDRRYKRGDDNNGDDDAESPVEKEKAGEEKARAEFAKEDMAMKARVEKAKAKAKERVVKEKEEHRGSESAAARQQTAIESRTVPAWKRISVYAEQAGEAYHTLCYESPVARTGLFALMSAIAWRYGVELPDLCLGGG
ncbi:hypothetical protein PG993_009421 [Apiospora rasikravindrae]|uniref:J domain-containing protein n=1 Tax=Apiospora rasikravindrae TaxID=990691 RepID=A0ABR1SJC4_9PEZI